MVWVGVIMPNIQLNEIACIRAHLNGDARAFPVLVQRYLKPIYRFAFRMTGNVHDAEDITQDAFLKAWRHIRQFDTSRSFKTWLFSVAHHACLDFIKKRKAIPFSTFDSADGTNLLEETLVDPGPLPDELAQRADAAALLARALAAMPTPFRTVLILHYNDHFTFRAIGEVLGEPLNTVKSRHRRALALLRERLIDQSAPK